MYVAKCDGVCLFGNSTRDKTENRWMGFQEISMPENSTKTRLLIPVPVKIE
jgi:hypothetical protein